MQEFLQEIVFLTINPNSLANDFVIPLIANLEVGYPQPEGCP